MDFLRSEVKKKVVRTTLYGDQEFSRWELEIIHTPIFQRLYNLKQLGFTDRVFPDAVHSRFNHVLGVTEMADKMAQRLQVWLKADKEKKFIYCVDEGSETSEITAGDLGRLLEERIPVVRLVALLHDLTHAAYGHTLEDEVCLFQEKHDDPQRQRRFFNALVAQMVYAWITELGIRDADVEVLEKLSRLDIDEDSVTKWSEEISESLKSSEKDRLARLLREMELAMTLLSYIEFMHDKHDDVPPKPNFLVNEVAAKIAPAIKPIDFVLHRDAFLIDMVGNTICADLLDYARRDAFNAGLKVQFDDRLIRYLAVVSVKDDLSPTRRDCIRLAIQFFTDKMRHDVLSEMSAVLKARYLINERVLFHPTKCAAGAMLGTAVQLLGLNKLPSWMQLLGDQEFISALKEIGDTLADIVNHASKNTGGKTWKTLTTNLRCSQRLSSVVIESLEHVIAPAKIDFPIERDAVQDLEKRFAGARNLLWRISARRYPKLAYRLRPGLLHSGGDSDETVAEKYRQGDKRFALERQIEKICHLPVGSIVIHCPRRQMSMKIAEVLVVGSNLNKVAKLRDVTTVSPEALMPYEKEIRAIEDMYRSIWQFHVYLDYAKFEKQPVVELALHRELDFPNDALFRQELKEEPWSTYKLLAEELHGEIPMNHLSEVVERVDQEVLRFRHLRGTADEQKQMIALIHDVYKKIAKTEAPQQMDLPEA